MNDARPLITIGIPTYNRSFFLNKAMNSIMHQVVEFQDKVEICISDNNSSDDTREIVTEFKKKYPSVKLRYNKNKTNLGIDMNFLKVFEMASGKFIWLFGDDDMMGEEGLVQAIKFIEGHDKISIGMIIGGRESYFFDKQTGEKITYSTTLSEDKPEVFEIERDKILATRLVDAAFISVQIFNADFLKQTIEKRYNLVQEGRGTGYIHMLVYRLMFLEYSKIKGFFLNKALIAQEMPLYKFTIEDEFMLLQGRLKIENLLLSFSKNKSNFIKLIFARELYFLKRGFFYRMVAMKSFNSFNYKSYLGCIYLFFRNCSFLDGLMWSMFFTVLVIVPSFLLRNMVKNFLKVKHRESWKQRWFLKSTIYSKMSKGERKRG